MGSKEVKVSTMEVEETLFPAVPQKPSDWFLYLCQGSSGYMHVLICVYTCGHVHVRGHRVPSSIARHLSFLR